MLRFSNLNHGSEKTRQSLDYPNTLTGTRCGAAARHSGDGRLRRATGAQIEFLFGWTKHQLDKTPWAADEAGFVDACRALMASLPAGCAAGFFRKCGWA